MDQKIEKLLIGLKSKKIGVFCDDSNLYHAYKKYGWRIDLGKLKSLFKKYGDLQFINYYIAIPSEDDDSFMGTMNFIKKIKQHVTIKKKKLKYTEVNGEIKKKGDVDVEITLDVIRNIDNLDVIIIMSGDSDYLELKNYVIKDKKKNILFMGYEENMAWELRQCWHLYINRIKDEIILD